MLSQHLREDLENIINEFDVADVAVQAMEIPGLGQAIAALAAMGIVLGPWLKRQRQIKKQRKEQCKKYQGLRRKKCMINLEIDALKKEKTKMIQSASQCNKMPEPKKSKCKQRIKLLVKDYDIKISKERKKIG